MTRRSQIWIAVVALPVGGVLALVLGLNAYVRATTTPIHPDPKSVPSGTTSAPPPKWAAAAEQARQLVRASVSEQNLPGLSIAVGAAADIVWAEGFGWADLEKQVRATPETRFRTGEVSKALTSAAVGLLLEKNKLGLDDEIHTWVPDYPKKQWPVTLRQLMGHLAGLPDDQGDEAWLSPCQRTLEGLQLFAKIALKPEPGTRYRASSYSWILVSAAVEAAANEPFFSVMQTRIFEPLGMTDTLPDSAKDAVPDRAAFYFPRYAGETRYGPEPAREGDHSCYAGGGAFLSTPSDLVRFGMAISGGKLLQPGTVELLQTSQRLASGEETGYGLGWKLETVPLAGETVKMAGHGTKADFIGGTTYLVTFPTRGIVVAVMTNTSFADMKSVAVKVAEVFAQQARRPASR